MNTSPKNAWCRIALSLTLVCLFGIPIYVALTVLSTAAADDLFNPGDGDTSATLLTSASVLTATSTVDGQEKRPLLDAQVLAVSGTVMPPDSVTINGPAMGLVNTSYTFTATVNPLTATGLLPLRYTWRAGGQDLNPPEHTSGLSDTITFTWHTTGTQTITVTATSTAGSVIDTHVINIGLNMVYMPLALNQWPPAPTMLTITNDGDGNYIVSWLPRLGGAHDTYTLQEDDDPAFSSPYTYSLTSMRSITVTGRVCGVYYYRVKATRGLKDSPWSNTETAVVNHLTIDDFDDGQDPNAIGGPISWEGPCVIPSPGDYDPINACGGSGYGYRLSYDVTPTCYATWQTRLLGKDFSSFSALTFQIKGAQGDERPNVYLQNTSSQRHYADVEEFLHAGWVMPSWKLATIPLDVFGDGGVDLKVLNYLQIVFEWEYMTGTIYVDEIRFECPTR
jgi:hypothetical protein